MFKGVEIIHKDIDTFLLKKVMLMLYHACIFPYRTYCIKVLECASIVYFVSKKIIRLMSFPHYLAHTNPL